MKLITYSGIGRSARLTRSFALGFLLFAGFAAAQTRELSESAKLQIQTLIAEKEARSPAQRKIDSQLIYAARSHLRQPITDNVLSLETGIEVDERGEVAIEIRAPYSSELATKLKNLGVSVIRSNANAMSIEALAPIGALEAIASEPSVRFVMPQMRGMIAGSAELKMTPRLSRFKAKVVEALAAQSALRSKIGSANSQGDAAHRAGETRTRFGVNGAGLRIGVLSDSFNNLGTATADVTSGDLPGPTNPNGYLTPVRLAGTGDLVSGGADEGRAMLQIVHDLAPGAELYYAEAFSSFANFAENIRALRGISASPGAFGNVSPGCDIIIDDIFYFVETGLHDGQPAPSNFNMAIVTQAVNDVVANGALYFSSAGNSGSVQQATSGAWEGDFATGTRPAIITGTGDALAWNGADVGNTLTGTNAVTMQWADPLGGSANDYDLFRLNAALTAIIASSTNIQTGTQDPFEQITGASSTRLVVVRRTGAAIRFISLSTNRGRLQYATTGQTRGHGASPNAFGVAATPAAASGGAPTPTGPSPGAFVGTNQIENFSSDGPRRSFFNAAGAAYTAGVFVAAGGILRQKPDFTAADGVATTLPGASGLNPFYGTSAAAPHAGAIAALVKQGSPSSTNSQITTFLTSTALDIMTPGLDAGSGAGILQAFKAVSATAAVPRAVLTLNTVSVPSGNGVIEPGDCNQINVSLNNTSQVGVTAVFGVLTSSTPGVTVTQAFSNYPTLNAASGASNITPFQISTAPSFIGGTVINFTLTVTYAGDNSPQAFTFTRGSGGASNYAFAATTGAAVPAGGTPFAGSNVDDAAFTFTSPFAITAYASSFGTTVGVNTNGVVMLSSAPTAPFINTALPGALPGVAYSAYWDDLDLAVTGGGIVVRVFGATPTRQLIVEWRGKTVGTVGTMITTTVALVINEGSSTFEYRYVGVGGTSANGAGASIGVQESTVGRFTQFSFNTASVIPGRVLTATLAPGAVGSGICPTSSTAITSIVPAGSQTVGVPYTVNVSVTGAGATGTVLVRDDTGASCTVTLPATSCLLTSTEAGTRTITAGYSGDANNAGSSATAPVTVVTNRQGLQVGSVILPATTTSNAITRISFAQAFNGVPVVIVQPSNSDADPQAVRIFNVTQTGFNALQVEAPGCAGCVGTGTSMDVHWLAATPGSYFLQATASRGVNRGGGGVLIKAGTVSTSASERGTVGFTDWPSTSVQAVSFTGTGTFSVPPVLLTTLQSWTPVNEGLNLNISTPNLTGASQVWATTVASNVSATGFNVAIESSEVNDDDVGAAGLDGAEIVGYVAIEGNTSGIVGQLGGGTVGIGTATTSATSTCTNVDVTMPGTVVIAAANLRGFVGKQSRNEVDGGWLRRCTFASPGSSVARMTVRVDEDQRGDIERTHGSESVGGAIFSGDFTTTPIALAHLSSSRSGNALNVRFATATEVGHLGYRIWGRSDPQSDWQALHSDLIVSANADGMAGHSYQRSVSGDQITEIRIEDVDILGRSRFHAATLVGTDVGSDAIANPLNWAAIRAANLATPTRVSRGGAATVLADVTKSGIQRARYEDMAAAGWPTSVASESIAVTDNERAVWRHVACPANALTFGPGCNVEWLASASESLYGAVNTYKISLDASNARAVSSGAVVDLGDQPRVANSEITFAPNRGYTFSAPGNDPWFDARLVATTAPVEISRQFTLPNRGEGPVSMSVALWGGLDFAGDSADHSVEILLNGQRLDTRRFDGLVEQKIELSLPVSLLQANNNLTVRVLADTGFVADVVLLDGFTVRYPRMSVANMGELSVGMVNSEADSAADDLFGSSFESQTGFKLGGITAPSVVWSQTGSRVRRDALNADALLDSTTSGFVVSDSGHIAAPIIRAGVTAAINTNPVDYLVVTHPLFEAELAPLIALEQSRGYSVRVLRTDEIYAARSDNAPSPQAIRDVISQINPRFVLLVGGDSYDYNNYLGIGSQSYVPTFYRAADPIVRFAATDAMFVDSNNDGAPERALGRIPARTVAELRLAISSIVQRGNTPATRYLGVAGASNAAEHFDIHSRSLLSYLRQGQPKDFALVDELGISAARAKAVAGLAGDADWVNYLGHSSPNRWAAQNLLDTSQLASINRSGIPAVVSQWGCWNNYFVLPEQDTMAHALMLRSNRLASVVIGSTSLAEDASHMALGTRFFDLVEDGRLGDNANAPINTLGEALRDAKLDLQRTSPADIESNYSMTLFGDPAAVIR